MILHKWGLKFRAFFVRRFAPFTLFFGKIGFPVWRKLSLPPDNILNLFEPGDMFLFGKKWEFSNLFIPGKYTHLAVYLGMGIGGPVIIEATYPVVRKISLEKVISHYTSFAVVRAAFMSAGQRSLIPVKASLAVGKPYDLYFENSQMRFYCSELGTWAIQKVLGTTSSPWQDRDIFGMIGTVPQDFFDSGKFLKICTLDV